MSGSVPIVLDRERKLRFDFNALADADEAVSGAQVTLFVTGAAMSLAALRALLWAGLRGDDPKLTIKHAAELLQDALQSERLNVGEVVDAVREAVKLSGIYGNPEKKSPQTQTANPSVSEPGSGAAARSASAS